MKMTKKTTIKAMKHTALSQSEGQRACMPCESLRSEAAGESGTSMNAPDRPSCTTPTSLRKGITRVLLILWSISCIGDRGSVQERGKGGGNDAGEREEGREDGGENESEGWESGRK